MPCTHYLITAVVNPKAQQQPKETRVITPTCISKQQKIAFKIAITTKKGQKSKRSKIWGTFRFGQQGTFGQ
jgi:hypothetical protein